MVPQPGRITPDPPRLRGTFQLKETSLSGRKMHPQSRIDDYVGKGWWTDETVQQIFIDRVAEFGDELAAIDAPNKLDLVDLPVQRVSWNEISAQVDALAAVLLANGIGEGDVLAVQLPNIVELIVAYLAAWRVRAIVSPLPVQYRRHEVVELGAIGEPVAFLTSDRIGTRPVAAEIVDMVGDIASLRTVLYYGPSTVAGCRQHRRRTGRHRSGRTGARRGLRRRAPGRPERLPHHLLDVGHREPPQGRAPRALRVAGDELGHGVLPVAHA